MNDAAVPPGPPPVAGEMLTAAEKQRIVLGTMLTMLLAAMDQTIVATALPTIGNELGDVNNLPWVVTSYLLAATAATPLYGKLSDIVGRRTMILTGVTIFLASSVLAALAPTMAVLIVARFLQGLGGGGLIALGQTVVADLVPPKERMRYQVYFAAMFAVASVGGPVLGGFLAERLHWSFIFWINLPIGALALIIASGALKRLPRHERPHKIDYIGALLMVIGSTALLLALSWGGATYPWNSLQVLGTLAICVASWILFTVRQLTAAEPFLPLSVMFNPVVALATGANFFIIGMGIGLTIYLPIYFVSFLHLTPGQSGLALIPFAGGMVVGAQLSGRVMLLFAHYKRTPVVGVAIAVVAVFVLAVFCPSLDLLEAELLLTLVGVSFGTLFPVATVSVQNAVQPHQLGTATAAYNFFRSLGSAVSVALLGAVFIGTLGVGGETIGSLDALVAAAAAQGKSLGPAFQNVFAAAGVVFVLGYLCLLGMKELPLRAR